MEEDEGGQKDHLESHLQCSRKASSSSEQTLLWWLISLSGQSEEGRAEQIVEEKEKGEVGVGCECVGGIELGNGTNTILQAGRKRKV